MIRRFLVVASAGGGVYGAYRILESLAERIGGGTSPLTMEAVPLLIPVGMIGALLGAFVGGVVLPKPRRDR